jgi:hypothetical protein
MKLFIDPVDVQKRARRWASLVSPGGQLTGSRNGDLGLVLNYLARHFGAEKKAIVQRRRSIHNHGRERYLLRPAASASSATSVASWVGLICDYDTAHRALRIMDRVAVQSSPLLPFERLYSGEIALESKFFAPAYCDGDAVAFLNSLPVAAEEEPSPTDHWRAYLEWQRALAATKAKEALVYLGWIKGSGRQIRFFLRDMQPIDKLRQRLQDEELRAGEDARDLRCAQGVFRRLSAITDRNKVRRLAVDIEYDSATYNNLDLPPQGELRVAMEGEMATLEVQTNGLRRLAERQAQNPHLSDWLFSIGKALPIPTTKPPAWKAELNLNEEQREAVGRALAMDDLLLLWGPPGTGKTTVIAEICAQYAQRGLRVLVASQANLAVEQALLRLPERAYLRPAWVSTARRRDGAAGDVSGSMRRWLKAAGAEAASAGSRVPEDDPWCAYLKSWGGRIDNLDDEELSPEFEELYLRRANVIGATCNETGKPDFIASPRFSSRFDLVIVDEVSKATPPELLLAMLMGRRVLLVGDHRQLPPMFRDEAFEDAVEAGEITRENVELFRDLVTSSLFESYFSGAPSSAKVGLRRQYRMHPQIMEAVNTFYADQPLLAGGGTEELARVKNHNLRFHGHPSPAWLKSGRSLVWIDTGRDTKGRPVHDERVGSSRRNFLEAEIAARLVSDIAACPDSKNLSIAIISFYRAQVELLRDCLKEDRELDGILRLGRDVNTVDQFQGSERDVVIVSLVRSDARLSGEFARDFRRINVALSRARKLLIVLGSQASFGDADVLTPGLDGKNHNTKAYWQIQELIHRHGALLDASAVLGKKSAQ